MRTNEETKEKKTLKIFWNYCNAIYESQKWNKCIYPEKYTNKNYLLQQNPHKTQTQAHTF